MHARHRAVTPNEPRPRHTGARLRESPPRSERPSVEIGRLRLGDADVRYLRTGRGTPLVLVHTLRTQLDYFLPLLDELDRSRYEVFALDLPGHGESTAPAVDYTAEYLTDAVARFLDAVDVWSAVVAGESIGGAIALGLAARRNQRVGRVLALNPYDYPDGIRRASALASTVFGAMLVPGLGAVVARSGSRRLLGRLLAAGLDDPSRLPDGLLEVVHRAGALAGHARAFRSMCLEWRSWVEARARYPRITVPVTLAYGIKDWSRPEEREANARLLPGARRILLEHCGHFSALDQPREVARLVAL
jgi:pimeloyl-ACP methyl ester carboxylesterase